MESLRFHPQLIINPGIGSQTDFYQIFIFHFNLKNLFIVGLISYIPFEILAQLCALFACIYLLSYFTCLKCKTLVGWLL